MVDNSFPTWELIMALGKQHKPGFTNGDVIFINFFTGILMEEYIEEDINVLYIHEFIHCMDMNLSEKDVLKLTEIILKNLRKF